MSKYVNKITIIVAITCLLVGRYVLTPKQQVKEVVKVVEVEKKHVDTKKKTVTKETTKADGSVVKETTEVENTVVDSDRSTKIDSKKQSSTGHGVSVGIVAIKQVVSFSEPLQYGIVIGVPIIGGLKGVGLVTTTSQVGLGVSVEF